jgi:hypothetical protein
MASLFQLFQQRFHGSLEPRHVLPHRIPYDVRVDLEVAMNEDGWDPS